jgi:hypothetical protein
MAHFSPRNPYASPVVILFFGFLITALSLLPNFLSTDGFPVWSPALHSVGFFNNLICCRAYLSILSVLKNEAEYLAEWIEYHLLVGVDKFWLIDNDSNDHPESVLRPYVALGVVNLSIWHGLKQQVLVYNYYLRILRNESFWVAVIDIDEFLVPVSTRSIPVILRRFEQFPGVTVHWLVFGTNGKTHKETGLVIERFKNHSSWNISQNRRVKGIVNPRRTKSLHIHRHQYVNNEASVNVRGERHRQERQRNRPIHSILRVHHYWTKSVGEFVQKRSRGFADRFRPNLSSDLIARVPRDVQLVNDVVTNDSIIEWAIPLVKQNLLKRKSF